MKKRIVHITAIILFLITLIGFSLFAHEEWKRCTDALSQYLFRIYYVLLFIILFDELFLWRSVAYLVFFEKRDKLGIVFHILSVVLALVSIVLIILLPLKFYIFSIKLQEGIASGIAIYLFLFHLIDFVRMLIRKRRLSSEAK